MNLIIFVLHIADFIRNLIERKQLIEAIRFICTFNLIDKFPPALLLKEYMEDAWQSFWTIWLAKESLDEKVPSLLFSHPIALLK